jgi:hypothetical protein
VQVRAARFLARSCGVAPKIDPVLGPVLVDAGASRRLRRTVARHVRLRHRGLGTIPAFGVRRASPRTAGRLPPSIADVSAGRRRVLLVPPATPAFALFHAWTVKKVNRQPGKEMRRSRRAKKAPRLADRSRRSKLRQRRGFGVQTPARGISGNAGHTDNRLATLRPSRLFLVCWGPAGRDQLGFSGRITARGKLPAL